MLQITSGRNQRLHSAEVESFSSFRQLQSRYKFDVKESTKLSINNEVQEKYVWQLSVTIENRTRDVSHGDYFAWRK
jgi:hypothetical protein